jgi:hypothetical protein
MTDSVMSPRTTKAFWESVDMLALSIIPSVSVYRLSDSGALFVQMLDDFHLSKNQIDQYIWVSASAQRVRAILKLSEGSYMYFRMRKAFDEHISANVYISPSLDLIERRLSNATFDAYRRKRFRKTD